jgi:hypothetical protein
MPERVNEAPDPRLPAPLNRVLKPDRALDIPLDAVCPRKLAICCMALEAASLAELKLARLGKRFIEKMLAGAVR